MTETEIARLEQWLRESGTPCTQEENHAAMFILDNLIHMRNMLVAARCGLVQPFSGALFAAGA